MTNAFAEFAVPVIQAPMAGGPSTPQLAAAVSGAGGLGFLAAGYKTAEQLRADIDQTRELTDAPFGVNLFVVRDVEVDDAAVERYAHELRPLAEQYGARLGVARYDDDDFEAKLEVVLETKVPIISFTFACPPAAIIASLQRAGISVWITVTEPEEARLATEVGADALICQGSEAGGHRGTFTDTDGVGEVELLTLLQLTAEVSDLPRIASGGLMDGSGIAAALGAGAAAAQLGTAFLLCPEAGTSGPHREALKRPGTTALTRTFSGRRARGIVNEFMREHEASAPSAYPHIHHMTAPLRAAARATGDSDVINLWAGRSFALARERPAAELVEFWNCGAQPLLP